MNAHSEATPITDSLTGERDDVLLYLYDLRNVPQPTVSDERLQAVMKMTRDHIAGVAEIVGGMEL